MKNIIIASFAMLMAFGCSSQKSSTTSAEGKSKQGGGPNFSQMLAEMDSDKDGKLSKYEVKGPLLNDFSKIDSDDDGFITMEELEKAPKPQRDQRPQRNK